MIFSALHSSDFHGRLDQLAGLVKRLVPPRSGIERNAVLTGPPGIGKTELLKQVYVHLFWKQQDVAPFFLVVNPALLSTATFAKTYLTSFLCQRLAFESRDQSLACRDELSLDGLYSLAEERNASWMVDLLDQYKQAGDDPLSALTMALSAPHRSALSSGKPVVVLIDEFHRLRDLRTEGTPDPRLVSLFETPLSFINTPHLITGCAAELQEMPVISRLERIPVEPLNAEESSARTLFFLKKSDNQECTVPPALLERLGGNPFYLSCVVRAVQVNHAPGERDFWNTYIGEVTKGSLAAFWTSVLKRHLPERALRRTALAVACKLYNAPGVLTSSRLAASLAVPESRIDTVTQALNLAGITAGEFGSLRPQDDLVLRDVIACLCKREFDLKSDSTISGELRDLVQYRPTGVRYALTLPPEPEAELVAAQSLEQIGKNHRINQEAIGQMQIAVIEACINARKHGRGFADGIPVTITIRKDRLEVAVESVGEEFIVQETGKPFGGASSKTARQGWGIPLMKRFADDVHFEKTDTGVKTIVTKKLSPPPTIPDGDDSEQ